MKHGKTIVRAAALVSSFGLIGSYVACQQNGGRLPGTGAPTAAAPATVPADRAAGTTAPAVTPANFGTKSAMVFKPDATGQPLFAGSKSGAVAVSPTLLSGSKSLVLTPSVTGTGTGTLMLGGSKSSAVFVPGSAGTLNIAGAPTTGTIVLAPATAPATRPAQDPLRDAEK